MKTSKIIAGLMLAVAVQTASAAVYECRQNGKVTAKLRENIVPTRVWGGIGCTVRLDRQ